MMMDNNEDTQVLSPPETEWGVAWVLGSVVYSLNYIHYQ